MLALVDNVLAEVQPVLLTQTLFCLEKTPENRLVLRANHRPIESGVVFYKMTANSKATINGRTGQFHVPKGSTVVFRAVFANQHADITICA